MSASDPFGLVGQVLDGQFRVDKLVGEGGFSAVYRGHHQGLNEPIAIKCLKLPAALGTSLVDTFVQRFRDESRILYRLSQGNLHIVRSIAAGTTQAPATGALVPYMVLEWLEGRSMQNDFTVRRTLGEKGRSLDEVIKLFDSAADGLGHAHAQGVAHRDLNPGNLFLAQGQSGIKMKVLDFGVAKLMHEGALNMGPRAATIGQIKIFAPAYGAPEQFDDRLGAVSTASDVYAFALILLEALRDKNVVDGEHLGDFANHATNPEKRPTPRSLGIDVPDEIEAAFARATTLDPAQRWRSASEFWQSLNIAHKVATERKYENAARETPPLAMGADPKATQKTPMARTMPLNTQSPQTPGLPPGFPRPAGAPRPRTPTTIGIPAPANARPAAAPASTNAAPAPAPAPAPVIPPGAARTLASPGQNAAPLAPPPRLSRPPSNMGMTPVGAPLAGPPRPGGPAPTSRASSPDRSPASGPGSKPNPISKPNPAPPTTRFGEALANTEDVADVPDESLFEAENEEESTKVHAPTPEILRTLALHDAANARAAAEQASANARPPQAGMMATQMGGHGVPSPSAPYTGDLGDMAGLADAARAAHDASVKPPHVDPGFHGVRGPSESSIPPPPDSGHTLMMAPMARGGAPPPGMGALPAPPPPMAAAPPAPTPLPLPAAAPQGPPPQHAGLASTLAFAPPMPMQLQTGRSATPPFGVPAATPHHFSQLSQLQGADVPWQAQSQLHNPSMPHAPMASVQSGQQGMHAPPPYGQVSSLVPPQDQRPQPQPPFGVPAVSPHDPQGQSPFGPSSAQLPTAAAPARKPLPIVPIAIGLGVLALGGIGLGFVALTMRSPKTPGAGAMTSESASATAATAAPTPAETASAAPSTEPEADAAPVVVAEEDAAPTAASASASAAPSATAAPTTTTSGPVFTWPPPPTTTATASAKPPPDPNAFSESAARSKLGQANGVLVFCKKEGGVTGPGSASVTFGPDGSVTSVAVEAPYAGTKEGDCVAGHFRRAKVNAFTGSPQTVRHSFEVPK